MSMISGLAKELRDTAVVCKDDESYYCTDVSKLLSQAADTIEQLSAKLHTSQMERSIQYDHGGWISCEERMPDTDDYILLSLSNFSLPLIGRYETDKDGKGVFYAGDKDESLLESNLFVNAWRPLPEPYRSK